MPSLRPFLRALPVGLTLAAAVVQAAPRSVPEVARPAIRSIRLGTSAQQIALSRGSAWREFTSRHGNWSVLWNEATGTPHRAFGRGIPLAGFANDEASVDRAVRRFMGENAALFGQPRDLELVSALQVGHLWYVRYRQTLGGIPVLDSRFEFRVGRNGKLAAFGADTRTPSAALLAAPRVGVGVAREAAKHGLAFDPARDRVVEDAPLFVLPYGGDYRLVYAVRVWTERPRHHWLNLVDAATGEVLLREDRVRWSSRPGDPVMRAAEPEATSFASVAPEATNQVLAAISGTVYARIHPWLPSDPLATYPVAHMTMKVGSTQVPTNTAGFYSATCTGNTTVQASFEGPYCTVTRLDGTNATLIRNANCPTTQDVIWDTNNSQTSERDAFFHVNRARLWVKAIDPSCTASDYAMGVSVNSIDDECVAYWDGFTITFGSEGAFCPYNMAHMPDIIYREWCQRHNDDLYFVLGSSFGMTNATINAATSDIMAAFMTEDPEIGDGIEGPGTYLRTLANDNRWPEDASTDPNQNGLILGGAFWDLAQSIGFATASNLLHFAKYGLPGEPPPTITDDGVAMSEYFIETLVADDDDADISNGTPHYNEILAAFNAHGIGTDNFLLIDHPVLEDQLTNGPYLVTSLIQYSGPIGGLNASSPTLYFSVNGLPYESLPMTPTGNPDEYGAEIPAQSGAIVKYYLLASDINGGFKTHPAGAPDQKSHFFIAGPASTVLMADMESNPGWTATTAGTSVTGGWVRVDPISDGGQAAPEDDHTPHPGTQCYVTGQGTLNGWPGEADVDNGTVTLTTGTFSAVGGIHSPIISYWRWYSNNAGEAPGTDTWKAEISNNDGGSWTTIENTMETDQSWRRVVFFIDDYILPTATMKMRFIASDLGNASLVEAGVDDFQMLGYADAVSVGPPAAGAALALAPAAPNPFRASTRIHYTLPRAGAVSLVAYDVHGRAVRRLADGAQQPGEHSLQWDGRDDAGRLVPSGPYFLKLEQGGERSTVAVVRIR